MTDFSKLGLAEPLQRAIREAGYTTPTPIQAGVIPALIEGRDVLGLAQTGTGKTAAFVLPILHHINAAQRQAPGKTCNALILAPTRELAAQIADSVRTYGRFTGPTRALVVGGVKPGPQVRAMARGVDVLVATPGRLLDLIQSGSIRLHQTSTVVLDEADQMLDLGFMPAIRRIMAMLPNERRTMLFSATLPKTIRTLAQDFLDDPLEVSVAPVSTPAERIAQTVLHVRRTDKREALVRVLADPSVTRAIVFTRTKRGADRVAKQMNASGLKASAIHGNKSQNQRERALAAFKSGAMPILIATDIAARGIDVDGVSHVVNYELPNVPESYVHRIGRTARAGKSGVAISLCGEEESALLRDIEKLIGRRIDAQGDQVDPPNTPPAKRGGGGGGGRNRQGGRPGKPGQAKSGSNAHPGQKKRSRRPRRPKAA
ncbi:MAG: DEAD/DEAH box helicase [Pseudomonadota bacterium]